MPDELITGLELPASARATNSGRHLYRRLIYEFRHRENHLQLVRFLCVGASGYVVNTLAFVILLHAAGLDYKLSFVGAFFAGYVNNFFWNRYWTFKAVDRGMSGQAMRVLLVQVTVAVFAYLIMVGLVAVTDVWKVPADMLAWILVTPLSFLVQKLWGYKA